MAPKKQNNHKGVLILRKSTTLTSIKAHKISMHLTHTQIPLISTSAAPAPLTCSGRQKQKDMALLLLVYVNWTSTQSASQTTNKLKGPSSFSAPASFERSLKVEYLTATRTPRISPAKCCIHKDMLVLCDEVPFCAFGFASGG